MHICVFWEPPCSVTTLSEEPPRGKPKCRRCVHKDSMSGGRIWTSSGCSMWGFMPVLFISCVQHSSIIIDPVPINMWLRVFNNIFSRQDLLLPVDFCIQEKMFVFIPTSKCLAAVRLTAARLISRIGQWEVQRSQWAETLVNTLLSLFCVSQDWANPVITAQRWRCSGLWEDHHSAAELHPSVTC